jgi:uncharacterized membrane protein
MTKLNKWPWLGILAVAALVALAMSLGFFG